MTHPFCFQCHFQSIDHNVETVVVSFECFRDTLAKRAVEPRLCCVHRYVSANPHSHREADEPYLRSAS